MAVYTCVCNVSARLTVITDKFTLFIYCNLLVLLSTIYRMQSKHKQTNCKHSGRKSYG